MPRTIGLMSGTSLDGVDAAWLDTDGVSVNAFGPTVTVTYDGALRRDLRAVLDLAPVLAPYDPRLSGLVGRLTDYHVRAVEKLGVRRNWWDFTGRRSCTGRIGGVRGRSGTRQGWQRVSVFRWFTISGRRMWRRAGMGLHWPQFTTRR